MPREKVTVEERIEAAKLCAEGRISQSEAAGRLGLHTSTVEEWVARYKASGALGFKEQERNTVYTEELRAAAVREYLEGKGSLQKVSAKYGLRSKTQLRDWIKVYNSGRDFNRKMSGGSRQAEAAASGHGHRPQGYQGQHRVFRRHLSKEKESRLAGLT